MKKLVSILLTLAMLTSLFSMVDVSALTAEKYLVDFIDEGGITLNAPSQYTPYQCNESNLRGVVRIGDGTKYGYKDYSRGFRYHSASGQNVRTMSFTMPKGYNTLSGVVGVCYHVPGVDSGSDPFYYEECRLTITVNSASMYNSGAIKVKQGYSFKVRAKEGSNVIMSISNPAPNNNYGHIIFGDPKLTYENYPDVEISFDKAVYRVGDTITPNVTGDISNNYSVKWYLDEKELKNISGSYIVKETDLGKTLRLVAYDKEGIMITQAERFLSSLTTVCIETETGQDVTSKEDYIDADLKIHGNEEFNGETQYDGITEIRGRGNTSWGFPKKSYKLKLDKKTNLCGMGKNKHWALISCYWDESFLRNKMSYDLSGEMGLNYASSVWVDVYLNGNYHGVYLLCEHIRVDDDRVEIYDWEGTAEDVAEAIYDANPDKISDDGDFADYMNENMSWITTGEVTYEGNTYKVSDYYTDEIPPIDGGYLLEMDTHEDEISRFKTNSGLNVNIKTPEFCYTNNEMFDYIKGYLQAVEDACISEDYTTTYGGKTVRYTDLCDLDSMVKWWVVNELFFNWDAGFNSNFMYKDIGGKLIFGPVWDLDISAAGYGTSYLYDQWQTWYYKRSDCMNLWFKEAVADPVFLSYAHDIYWKYRDNFERLIAEDGYMEKSYDQLHESGIKNTELWLWRDGYEEDYRVRKEWLRTRLDWLDEQFATEESLIESTAAQTSKEDVTDYSSIKAYGNSADMSIDLATKSGTAFLKGAETASAKYIIQAPDSLLNSVKVTDNGIVTIKREINGSDAVVINIVDGNAEFPEISHEVLNDTEHKSVILYTGYSASGEVRGKVYATVSAVECSHTNTETVAGVAPTCQKTGLSAAVKCTDCGVYTTLPQVLSSTPHTEKVVKGYGATCSKFGYTDGKECAVCGEIIENQKIIPKNNKHNEVVVEGFPASCILEGISDAKRCKDCGKTTVKARELPLGDHSYKTDTTEATLTKNGKTVKTCLVCATTYETTIRRASTVRLSAIKYTYNGKYKTPKVIVKDSSGKTISSKNYTVSGAKKAKKIGAYKIKITFKGDYKGSRTLTYTINPKKVSGLKLKAGKKQMTVSWKKDSKVGGYEIVYATNSKFSKGKKTETVKSAKTAKKVIKKLKAKKTYYVKVRSFKKVSGKTYYGAYASVKKVKIK